jgi:hypothetical protein
MEKCKRNWMRDIVKYLNDSAGSCIEDFTAHLNKV